MRRMRTCYAILVALWIALPLTTDRSVSADDRAPSFESSARLVFKTHCFQCHGEDGVHEGGLDLRLRRLIVKGGDSGAAITPHDAAESYLWQRMIEGDMPPEEVTIRPSADELETVRKWIQSGAVTARAEPEDPDDLPKITPEERAHWAFQPIRSTVPPTLEEDRDRQRVRTPIDAFVLQQLLQQGMGFSPDADRRTLIRRASFDLTGLPPTPAEVDAFVRDDAADAWPRLIDRLLDSPRYGERWGRHWLDVVGYADSEGFTESDADRPYAYKYRDYVIESFNADKPFDQFIHEQIAGDEMVSSPLDRLDPDDQVRLIATGFLRMAPDGTGSGADDVVLATNAVVTETINIVSSALMGMTVGCAQCHDHRFDPITHEDFYRLRAVFEPAMNPNRWKTPQQRRIQLRRQEESDRVAEIQQRIDQAQAVFKAKESECIEMVFERELKKIPEQLRESARTAFHASPDKRSSQQQTLLVNYPNLRVSGGGALDLYLELFDEGRAAKKELDQLKGAVAKVRAELPKQDYIRALTEDASELPVTHVFHRGDPAQPADRVSPGSLTVLDHLMPVDFAVDNETMATSGRRLALARHLTHHDHPLTARVLVNRFWMHHFGRGLVETPGDFGSQGQPPTHPLLLDWLARDFIDHGWQVKRLHKMIMLSTVYRQSSQRLADGFDPDNRFYSRQSIRRLEAETIRDSILLVSGGLSFNHVGPATGVELTSEGQTVVNADADQELSSPRSVYVQTRRSTPLAMLEVFDAPRLEPNCTRRNVSTVTPQSLMLMNSRVVVEQARGFADRVLAVAGASLEQQVERAWEVAYGEPPSDVEEQAAIEFLQVQAETFARRDADQDKADPPLSAAQQALSSLCMVLVGSNRFLYVD